MARWLFGSLAMVPLPVWQMMTMVIHCFRWNTIDIYDSYRLLKDQVLSSKRHHRICFGHEREIYHRDYWATPARDRFYPRFYEQQDIFQEIHREPPPLLLDLFSFIALYVSHLERPPGSTVTRAGGGSGRAGFMRTPELKYNPVFTSVHCCASVAWQSEGITMVLFNPRVCFHFIEGLLSSVGIWTFF